jgi:hypothetical protein
MKKLMIALAAVAVAASPALAKKYHQQATTDPDQQTMQVDDLAYQSYDYVPSQTDTLGLETSPPVYAFGLYQGADPDPFIRLQLFRDPPRIQQ